ncbi:unnamed protein product [Notodromas monacha]|uniref:Uncharacterized protein n=1 Tax=Notodromas monacha TaxID=399045 RepID=A0A7R9C254_9CRUS|nr:unnamed protein product [Notodromas monacha]CAG0925539.1 unnamed protein product [Notodromas monacha]
MKTNRLVADVSQDFDHLLRTIQYLLDIGSDFDVIRSRHENPRNLTVVIANRANAFRVIADSVVPVLLGTRMPVLISVSEEPHVAVYAAFKQILEEASFPAGNLEVCFTQNPSASVFSSSSLPINVVFCGPMETGVELRKLGAAAGACRVIVGEYKSKMAP